MKLILWVFCAIGVMLVAAFYFGRLTLNEALTLTLLAAQLVVFVQQRQMMQGQLKVTSDAEARAQKHDRLSVRPFLDFDSDGDRNHLKVVMINHGAGVALNVLATTYVDGVAVLPNHRDEWPSPLLRALGLTNADLNTSKPQRGYLTIPKTTMGAGDRIEVIDFHFSGRADIGGLTQRLRVDVEFQSLYGTEDGTFHNDIDWSKIRMRESG